jgi:hypothetical protein
MMVNDELKRMWKEVFVASFKALSWNWPGWTQEKPKPGRPKWPGQDSNRVPFQTQIKMFPLNLLNEHYEH